MQSLGTSESTGSVNLEVVDGQVSIPDPQILVDGDYSRSGQHLVLEGEDGASLNVLEYFSTSPLPNLISPGGQSLNGETVALMAGPNAPGQYAQAGGPSGATPIGQVETLSGGAVSQRTDGVEVNLSVGAHVFQGDVLKVDAGGSLGITFADETVMSLEDGAKIVLNEMVYSPSGSDNSMLFSLVQGAASFVTGAVPKTGDMEISTPVAVMAIRGTIFAWACPSVSSCKTKVIEGATLVSYGDGKQIEVDADGSVTTVLSSGSASQRSSNGEFDSVFEKLQQVVDSFERRQSEGDEPVEIKKTGGPNGVKETDLGERLKSDDDLGTETAAAFVTPLVEATAREEAVEEDGEVTPSHLNAAPVVFEDLFLRVSEEGLPGSYPDEIGEADTTNAASVVGQLNVVDGENDALTFLFTDPSIVGTTADGSEFPLTSGGVEIVWDGVGTGTIVGTAGGVTVVTATVSETGWVEVYLEGPIDHPDALIEDEITLNFPISVDDGLNDPVIVELNVTIEDDFVDPSVLSLDGLAMAIDETPGEQKSDLDPDGAPGALKALGGILAYSSATAPQVMDSIGSIFGADGSDGTVDFALVNASGDPFSTTVGVATNLYTTSSSPSVPDAQIFLYAHPTNSSMLVGRIGGADGEIAFAVLVEPVDTITAKVSIAEFLPIEGVVDGGTTDDWDEELQLTTAAGEPLIFFEATVTDPDTDFTDVLSDAPLDISFYDDGPDIGAMTVGSAVELDESDANSEGTPGSFPLTATSAASILSYTPNFGADGQAETNPVVYTLSIIDGGSTPLKTAIGDHDITLVQTDPNTITGQYDGTNTAFTLDINGNGTITLTQQVALEHVDPDHNDDLDLSGLVTAHVLITDSDGDTDTDSAPIGDVVTFYDDGPDIGAMTVGSAVELDESDANSEGTPGSFPLTATSAASILSYTPNFGADGQAETNPVVYTLSIIDGGSTPLKTAIGDHDITLVQTDPNTITGQYDGTNTAFTLDINGNGTITLTQQVALEHVDPDHNDDLDLSGLVTAHVLITDSDGDTDTDSAPIGDVVTFYDDGPDIGAMTVGSAVELDESDANSEGTPGSFPLTATSAASILSYTPNFGADGQAETNPVVYTLSIIDGGSTPLKTAIGDHDITLVQTDPNTITGQYDGTNTAFTLDINGNGTITLTQQVALEHVDPDHNDDLDLSGLVTAHVLITDSDGDTDTDSAPIGDVVTFYDDGPDIGAMTVGSAVELDESDANSEGTPGSFPLTATSAASILSYTPNFGADGQAETNPVVYTLSIIDGGSTPLKTAIGDHDITLVQTDPNTITGQYDGTNTAFTLDINGNGTITLTQQVALEHVDPDHNDDLDLSGLVTAHVLITDSDGDTDTDSAPIGDVVTFYDDGPDIGAMTVGSAVELDESDANSEGTPGSFPLTATSAASILSYTPNFGADGQAETNPVVYTLSIVGGGSTPLTTAIGDYPITLVLSGDATTITGEYTDDGGVTQTTAFTVEILDDGKITLTQEVPLEHVAGNHNDTLNLDGLIDAHVLITDSDGDTDTASTGIGDVVTFYDDGLAIGTMTVGSAVELDESDANTPGGFPLTATSAASILSYTPDFGADGEAETDPVVYTLSIVGGGSTPLTTAIGDYPITLVLSGDATTITGEYTDDGGVTQTTAFTVEILDDGKITLTQEVPLEHVAGNHNDTLNLDGLIDAHVLITDSDGDTDTASTGIGDVVTFYDDGLAIGTMTVGSAVELDESDANTPGGFPLTATSAASILSYTPDFGADGEAETNPVVYTLSIVGGGSTPLTTAIGDYPITLVLSGDATTITGEYTDDGGVTQTTAFTVEILDDGKITLTQEVPLEHVAGNHNDTLNLDGLIDAHVLITDSDGDTDTDSAQIGDVISFYDDGPLAVNDADNALEAGILPETFATGNVVTGSEVSGDANTDDGSADDLGADGFGAITWTGEVTDEGTTTVTGAYGTLTVDPDGSYSYAIDNANSDVDALSVEAGQELVDMFTYTISDNDGDISQADLVITIAGANDAPVAVDDAATTNESTFLTIDVLANDTDVDHFDDPSTFTLDNIASTPVVSGFGEVISLTTAEFTINAQNELVFDPGTDFDSLVGEETATVTVDYTMSDDSGAQSTGTVTVTVTADGADFEVSSFGGKAGRGEVKTLQLDDTTQLLLTSVTEGADLNNNNSKIGVKNSETGPDSPLGVDPGEGIRADLVKLSGTAQTHIAMSLFQATVIGLSAGETGAILIKAFMADDDEFTSDDPAVSLSASDITIDPNGHPIGDIEIYETEAGIIVTGLQDGDVIKVEATTDSDLADFNFNRVEFVNVSGDSLADFDSGIVPESSADVALLGDAWSLGGLAINTAGQNLLQGDPTTTGTDTDTWGGTAGDDLMVLAAGIDVVSGNGGSDVFKITMDSLADQDGTLTFADTITDYEQANDVIDLTELFIVDSDDVTGDIDNINDFVQLVPSGGAGTDDDVLQIDINGSSVETWTTAAVLEVGSGVTILYNLDGEVQQETLIV